MGSLAYLVATHVRGTRAAVTRDMHRIGWAIGFFALGCSHDMPSPSGDAGASVGYRIEVAAAGVDFATDIAFDDRGDVYFLQSGWRYPETFVEPRLVALEDGHTIAIGADAPWTGVVWSKDAFVVTSSGLVSAGAIWRITREGESSPLLQNLPSMGAYPLGDPAVDDRGDVIVSIGSATNAGVVSDVDTWLARNPDFHDIPCSDVMLSGASFVTPNPLTPDPNDTVTTGAFHSFGSMGGKGEVVRGQLPCTGSLMRIRADGTLELHAWGFRNPSGVTFADGSLWVLDRGFVALGSRPVPSSDDVLWKTQQNVWYGWPDYWGGSPIEGALLDRHPMPASSPSARFTNGTAGLAIVRGHAFTATKGALLDLDIATQKVRTIPMEIDHPMSVRAGPDGSIWVADLGVVTVDATGPHPRRRTGHVWKVTFE